MLLEITAIAKSDGSIQDNIVNALFAPTPLTPKSSSNILSSSLELNPYRLISSSFTFRYVCTFTVSPISPSFSIAVSDINILYPIPFASITIYPFVFTSKLPFIYAYIVFFSSSN